jgi:hypothetical protein
MNVPRPLLVVVVVIIVLGVIACGAGVIRGRMENGDATPEPTRRFEGFGDSAIPRREVTFGGDCENDPDDESVAVNGTCATTLEPRFLRPRKLIVTVSGGDVNVTVRQEIRGKRETQSDTVDNGDEVEVAVAGTSPVSVFFSCTCSLIFSE